MTGGPPDSTPMMRTPESAVHEVTMLKEKPTIPSRPKLRFNSMKMSARCLPEYRVRLTLSIAQLCEHIVVAIVVLQHFLLHWTRCHVYQLAFKVSSGKQTGNA